MTAKTALPKKAIIEYLTKNVSVTSQEIAELPSVGLSRTKGLLRELVVEEVVMAEGVDRNRTYRLKR